ncbi:hypothetical protein XA68_13350 [Ophiocordyceps unilateralis]|uniref:CREG-like beta-barrel domain-containing protein n=1 Tax=Ophiocordyceps unilateralis TaxID=268505 RepID=A0A2A9PCM6_OPHUN|nr:hypothetical protein XA68_13350 [Ophiocordyceps unilateralis]
MKPLAFTVALSGLASAFRPPQIVFENAPRAAGIPTSRQSAVLGRRILALSKLATFSTVFPNPGPDALEIYDESDASSGRPDNLAGVPVGLVDYVADCEDQGNPTVLAVDIGTSFRNVQAGSKLTISMSWTPPYPPAKRLPFLSRILVYVPIFPRPRYNMQPEGAHVPDTVPYSAANLPRFSLFGYLEPVGPSRSKRMELASCYVERHQDAKIWLPGTDAPHKTEWNRFVVTAIYWVGGFGDRAYIGWIPVDQWRNVTRDEWESVRLPGERKGWDEHQRWDQGDL